MEAFFVNALSVLVLSGGVVEGIVLFVLILRGFNALRVRSAVRRHRADIEALFDWFLRDATVSDRDALSDIGWHEDGAVVFVFPRVPGWFLLQRTKRSPQRYQISIWKVEGRFVEQFPPYGTTCHEPWFNEGMRAMFNVIETWPREWLRSERARIVASGKADPLYVQRPKH